jgi:hypothetical protein
MTKDDFDEKVKAAADKYAETVVIRTPELVFTHGAYTARDLLKGEVRQDRYIMYKGLMINENQCCHLLSHAEKLERDLALAVSLLKDELDTDSVNIVRDFFDKREEFIAKLGGGE